MRDHRTSTRPGKARPHRAVKLAPMTRAVRSVLAVSAMTVALGLPAGAVASGVKVPATQAALAARPVLDLAPVFDLTAVPMGLVAQAIDITDPGDITIDNVDPVTEASAYDAIAIRAYSTGGNVDIVNAAAGELLAVSSYGSAIGLYGYSATGDVAIDNAADITAVSYNGLADGIFASGADVNVSNSGAITAVSVYGDWAAGVEAQGTGATQVDNTGDIYAASGYGHAFGLYATGADVTVANAGGIEAQGYYATGIEAQSSGDLMVDNTGAIVAGLSNSTALAVGINATSNGEGAHVDVSNAGDMSAQGYFGASAISATSSGIGGSAGVTNTGALYASQATKYGYGAYGVVVSADGDATIDNAAGGSITVVSAGTANGATALSFAGDASVTNAGDIAVTSTAFYSLNANGIVSFSANGAASADNSGSIDVTTFYIGTGIDVGGLQGASAANSGDIAVDAWRAYGIRAESGSGDVAVDNSGTLLSTYSYSGGTAFGILGIAGDGDVSIANSGGIQTLVTGQSVGIFGTSAGGDVAVTNSGTIDAYSSSNVAVGAFARASYGTSTVQNDGAISAYSYAGNAFGVLARGAYVEAGNGGDIEASGYASATGIAASSYYGTTVVNGGGTISAIAVGSGIGVDAQSAYGDVVVDNASSIQAVGVVLGARGIQAASGAANVTIDNSADVYAGSLYGDAIGLYGYSVGGDVAIANSGDLTAVSYYGLADGIFASGANVDVANSGAIQTTGYTWAAGIEAQGDSSATVQNDGAVSAIAIGPGGKAYGLYATGGDAVSVGNTGDVEAQGYYATGIEARSYGDLAIDSSGNITAGYANEYGFYSALATGINASSGGVGAAVNVANGGDIAATGFFGASGISATAGGPGGTVHVSSDGNIDVVQGNKYGYGAYGVVASGDGDTLVENGGGIGVYSAGAATGVAALSFAGAADVANAGDIEATSTAMGYYGATGILAFGANGTASVQNTGSVSATAAGLLYSEARAVDAQAFGDVSVANAGSLYANGQKYAFGVYATSGTGDLAVNNAGSGDIGFYSYVGRGWGVFGLATQGDVAVNNAGTIAGYAYDQAAGVFAVASAGDATVTNSGSIAAVSGNGAAVGVFARADYGTANVTSSGDIEVSSPYLAYGVIARGADAVVTNRGTVSASAGVAAIAVAASGYYSSTVNNTGTLHAGDAGFNVGVLFSDAGGNVLNNSGAGLIYASGADGYAFAVVGGNADETLNNSGRVLGALSLYGGDDVLHNKAGGTWDIGSTRSTDFGDGDDVIDNQAGAILRLANGALSLGAAGANGNAFNNAGTIQVAGSDNLIDMGTTVALLPGANPLPLVNTGIIDFVDGATDDGLAIAGSLGGSGAINVDMDLDNLTSDQLYVGGDIANGAVQTVNVSITRMPTTASTQAVEFAHVAGASSAGSFVGGKLVGYSPSNFLDIGARTTREAGGAGDATFLVALDVLGVNDTGALAATTATAAATFLNSQVGTFRQRLGVNPYGDADKVMNAFVRFYSSEGDVNPTHSASNFGQGGRFGFAQNSWGREVGINANLPGNVHAGLVLGNADSRQRLSDGVGENRMDGATVGAYATWYAPGGFYVDLSGRWMASDIRSTTAAGTMAGRAHAQATSLEAGYEWTAGGLNVVPQLQYTRTKVDGIRPLQGTLATFQSHGGTFEQGRIGVEVNRTFEVGGLRWTPYGSINAVHEFDGKTTYSVDDNFHGSTGTKGTSTMAELGLGLQKGRFGVGLGLNWTDGGVYKRVVGGQAVARFSW